VDKFNNRQLHKLRGERANRSCPDTHWLGCGGFWIYRLRIGNAASLGCAIVGDPSHDGATCIASLSTQDHLMQKHIRLAFHNVPVQFDADG
jgi:hypothetical protein